MNTSVTPNTTTYQPPVFADDNRLQKVKDLVDPIDELFVAHAKTMHIPGISYAIVMDDSLVLAGSTGLIDLESERPATTLSSFRIASMTKSFTAMAILSLRDAGKLSLQDPAADYINEMNQVGKLTDDSPVITIENLLTMTAGFPEDNPWGDRQLDESNEMLLGLVQEGVSFSNATSFRFEYSNLGYALLGNIVSQVSGMPYQEYIKQEILLPLGMKNTYWEYANVTEEDLVIGYRWEEEQWKEEPILHDGSFGAMGGLITSIEDFSKYVRFHLSAWPPRNGAEEGPLKRSSLREMHWPRFPGINVSRVNKAGEPCPSMGGYGYGLGISRDCSGRTRVSHGGALPGFGSNYVFFPDYGVGVMAFCNLTYTTPWPWEEIEALLFDSIGLEARKLPASKILLERQKQVTELIQNWDTELESKILAENFYLDKSRELRMAQIQKVLEQAGPVQKNDPIEPSNQLRGRFNLQAQEGVIRVSFTLSPEKDPKVQYLEVSFQPNSGE